MINSMKIFILLLILFTIVSGVVFFKSIYKEKDTNQLVQFESSSSSNKQIQAEEASTLIDIAKANEGLSSCQAYLNYEIIPILDEQTIIDTNYLEVLELEEKDWVFWKLPKQVQEFKKKNYVCQPKASILKIFDTTQSVEATTVTTSVDQIAEKAVEWSCQLEYKKFNYNYLLADNYEQKKLLENEDFSCSEQFCLAENKTKTYVWFCEKNVHEDKK